MIRRARTGRRGQPKIVINDVMRAVKAHRTITATARVLGVSRMTIMRRLREATA
jgi:transcriptional regulator of acetoin/glycerol metabolism